MQEINLLPETEKNAGAPSRRRSLIVLISTMLVGVFLAVVVGLFGFYTLSEKTKHDLKVSAKPLEDQVNQLSRKEWLVRARSVKASSALDVVAQQAPFRQTISRIVELTLPGITLSEIGVAAPNRVILSGRAVNTNVLDMFLGRVTAKEFGRKSFSDIVLQSLVRNDKGEYEFSVRFSFTEQVKQF